MPTTAFKRRPPRAVLTRAGLAALAALALGACANNPPPPTAQLAVTRTEISNAEAADARDFAPLELQSAREKLTRAQAAMRNEDYRRARYLAEQAEADARLAATRARTAKASRAAQEVRQGIDTLRQEIDRRPPPR